MSSLYNGFLINLLKPITRKYLKYFKDKNYIQICARTNHKKGLKDSQKQYSYGSQLTQKYMMRLLV